MSIIPIGYKDSPIGIIPQEWEVKKLKDISKVLTGSTPSTTDLSNYGSDYMFVSPVDMSENKKYIYKTEKMLSRKGYSISRKMPIGSVLYTCIGSTIGKIGIASSELTSNQQINAIICNEDNEFLYYVLLYNTGRIRKLAGEQAVPIIKKSDFENLNFPIPPLAEQKKIAEILCTWDDAIEKQSKLIEKLELRKRGLMQRLLTGKTRLPGFTEPWINIRIGELCLMKRGEILVSDDYIFGDIPVVAGGKEPAGFHNISNRNGNIITISSSGASAGFVAFYEKPIFATDCFTISSSEKYNVRFFYYYLMMSQERIYRLQSGGAQPHVHPKDLAPMMLRIPSLEEQNAVVKIILSSDKEIETQRKKLEALRQQKQGLMQQLLTGKTRVKI